jgi:serine protease
MKKSMFCALFLSIAGFGVGGSDLAISASPIAQTQNVSDIEVLPVPNSELFYLYKGEKIPLKSRPNEIAVAFKPQLGSSRTPGGEPPLYQQLATSLNQGSVRGDGATIAVKPVGTNYAIVTVPSSSVDMTATVKQVQAKPYVSSSLPVLSRADQQDTIVLTNEIIVSFQPDMPESEQKGILKAQNLEVIRSLRFTKNRYLVKVKSATGTDVLKVSNRLNQVVGIASASPNFLQVLPNRAAMKLGQAFMLPSNSAGKAQATSSRGNADVPYSSDLWPMLWHLDSRSRLPNQPRIDVRAPEAWQQSNGGKDVVVAVMDNLIQWDHPNLVNSLYKPDKVSDRLPDEVSGWDFAQNDADTRISDPELDVLRPNLQKIFQISDQDVLAQYAPWAKQLQADNPNASKADIAEYIRYQLRVDIAANFHGTQTSAVIAAHPVEGKGIVGIAPNVKILPVRVGNLGTALDSTAIIEGVGYAAQRGADVINMSFGGGMPTTDQDNAIATVLEEYPKLVIVVSSGNEDFDRPGFPALVKGTIAVGATTVTGQRAPYSNYGLGLDLVAPGGDTDSDPSNGMLTASGLGTAGLWQGITLPKQTWLPAQDLPGHYQWTQGTSFSAPAVAGVVALMKGEDPDRKLSRNQIITILKSTAGYEGLQLSQKERALYQTLKSVSKSPPSVNINQYFFGSGLVNAGAAVKEVKRSMK